MRTTTTLLTAAAALALAGCGNAAPASTSSSSSTRPSTTVTVDPSPTTTDAPKPGTGVLALNCEDGGVGVSFTSLNDAWHGDTAYACIADASGYTPTPAQAAAAVAYAKSESYYGEGGEAGALADLLGLCAAKDMAEETVEQQKEQMPFVLKACPNAPHAKMIRSVLNGEVIQDGDYAVGLEVKPGTYRTGRVSDCYWERTTKGGDTLANDFVKNAPGGVTVTIRSSDGGFSSDGCGPWRRVR